MTIDYQADSANCRVQLKKAADAIETAREVLGAQIKNVSKGKAQTAIRAIDGPLRTEEEAIEAFLPAPLPVVTPPKAATYDDPSIPYDSPAHYG